MENVAPMTPSPKTPVPGSKRVARSVLPDAMPPEIVKLLKRTLQSQAIVAGLQWLVDHIPDGSDPTLAAEHLADQYEQQIRRLKVEDIEKYLPAFRVAFSLRCVEVLPLFSMKMANHGYNYIFVKIWLQKRALATMTGISITDVERRARTAGKKISAYLEDELHRVYPFTCLAKQCDLIRLV